MSKPKAGSITLGGTIGQGGIVTNTAANTAGGGTRLHTIFAAGRVINSSISGGVSLGVSQPHFQRRRHHHGGLPQPIDVLNIASAISGSAAVS